MPDLATGRESNSEPACTPSAPGQPPSQPDLAVRHGNHGSQRRGTRLSLASQRQLYLLASGMSTAGSFAGLTAKSWILLHDSGNALILALHFGCLALPSLVLSGPAGVATDRLGCEKVLIRAQWGLFGAALLGALAIPLLRGQLQVAMLLLSTLLVGVASSYELTARNK